METLATEEKATLEQGLDIADALAYLTAVNAAADDGQEDTLWNVRGALRADLLEPERREALHSATRLA